MLYYMYLSVLVSVTLTAHAPRVSNTIMFRITFHRLQYCELNNKYYRAQRRHQLACGHLRPRRAYKLRGSATQLHSRLEEDWSIQSKRRQDKFLCYRVVYKRTVSIFQVLSWVAIVWHMTTVLKSVWR